MRPRASKRTEGISSLTNKLQEASAVRSSFSGWIYCHAVIHQQNRRYAKVRESTRRHVVAHGGKYETTCDLWLIPE